MPTIYAHMKPNYRMLCWVQARRKEIAEVVTQLKLEDELLVRIRDEFEAKVCKSCWGAGSVMRPLKGCECDGPRQHTCDACNGTGETPAGVRVPVVVDGRTEEQWCQEACRIGAYDYVEVVEGVKGRWIRTFTSERTTEKIEQSIKALKAQAERYDRTHGVPAAPALDLEALFYETVSVVNMTSEEELHALAMFKAGATAARGVGIPRGGEHG